MKVTKTDKNMEIIEFIDNDGNECSIQQSSLATYQEPGASALRIGINDKRMHLNLQQLKGILPHLQAWIDNGTLEVLK